MAHYTDALDAFIGQQLRLRGALSPSHLAGFTAEEADALLRRYLELHGGDPRLSYERGELTLTPESIPPAGEPPSPIESPVDMVADLPRRGSLLDVEPSGGPFPRWAWWLPLTFGALGGLAAWAIVRDANKRAAKHMLITGAVVQVASLLIGVAMIGAAGGALGAVANSSAARSSAWPTSASGRVTFYYFGTST